MRGLAPRIPMCQVLSTRIQYSAVLTPIGVSDSSQSSYNWCLDSRYPTMSVQNTQRSLPDSKSESGEEQGPFK
jgi:hypothetical protein